MKKIKKVMIDPPGGWRFGFPMEVLKNITTQEVRQLLIRQKYPENEIEFALAHMRWLIFE